jgi:energy-coupling factor transporter ATP-binding protein EcfA2
MSDITLTPDQKGAIGAFQKFLKTDEQYMVIQGAAGCGKSTLVEYLMKALEAQYKLYAVLLKQNKTKSDFQTVLTATTNKAAAVLGELTGMSAQTIHSFLRLKVTPNVSTGTVKLTAKEDYTMLYNKLVILDESSMLNDDLFKLLTDTVHSSKIVLIGDKYQLAPVRQKESIMENLECTKVTLNKIIRNSGPIMKAGQQFRHTVEDGVWKDIAFCDELKHVDGPTFQKLIDSTFKDKNYHSSQARVLAWTNKRVLQYNNYIRELRGYPSYLTAGETVYTNKPIMAGSYMKPTDHKINVTQVGDLIVQDEIEGRMIQLDKAVKLFLPENFFEAQKKLKLVARQAKKDPSLWGTFFRLKEGWLDLRPPFASTVHKAQGATYETVFIDLADIGRCNQWSDVARMMYVAISRASKQVYFYGELPKKYRGKK